ncbi:MAG: sulfotransferase family protein [Egibacteraceae bacterium]
MPLPDFFVIGAPKAGTTALHTALAIHPELFMSRVKEPKFFLCDGQPPPRDGGPGDAHSYREWIWRKEEYEALFAHAPSGTLRGESTPFYLSDFAAQERIRQLIPQAKLIAILRNPVDRAYSNWTHMWSDGLEPIGDFVAACAEEERRAEAGWVRFWRYRGLGLYGEQLQHLFSVFPRDQVHLLRYKELVDQPHESLNRVCEFLGVAPDVVVDVPSENVSTYVPPTAYARQLQALIRGGAAIGRFFPPQLWRKTSIPLLRALQRERRNRPELGEDDRRRLIAYFADDIRTLERVTGLSFSDWLTHRAGGTYSVRRSWAPSRRVAS